MECSKLLRDTLAGIEFRYKMDDVISEIPDNQKFSAKQLEGYLLKRGVSPKEIKQSEILAEAEVKAISAQEWKGKLSDKSKITEGPAEEPLYSETTLGSKGGGDYKETLATIKKPSDNAPSMPHFGSEVMDENYGPPVDGVRSPRTKTLLGWRRTHQDNINGKPTTVLNEFQSDWAQTERAGRGKFTSTQKKLADRMDEVTVADFPMSDKKFHQYQIVATIDEAIKNGTNRVAIPIEREGELQGSAGVTKFYDSLNKSILPDIRKKLEKQGMRLKLSKEEFEPSYKKFYYDELVERKGQDFVDAHWEELSEYVDDAKVMKSFGWLDGIVEKPELHNALAEILDDGMGQKNNLHIVDIVEIPNKKVTWDVYGILGALGLSEMVSEMEETKAN